MARHARRLIVLGVAPLLLLLTPAAAAAKPPGVDPGVYRQSLIITCAGDACAEAGVLPPWMKSLENPFQATVDRSGKTYDRATIIAVGKYGPHRCDASLFSKPFSGRCVVEDFGVGYVAPSTAPGPRQGEPDFYVSHEAASFNGGPIVADPFAPYPLDTGNPAVPGRYDADDIIGSQPKGVHFTIVVHFHE